MSGTAGSAGAVATGGAAGNATGGTAPDPLEPCRGSTVTTPKRLVRLSDTQIVESYEALFGPDATETFVRDEMLSVATRRSFPPLATTGTAITEGLWSFRDRLASRAKDHVVASLGSLTRCGAEPNDEACGREAVLEFAERAFRRPLSAEEKSSYEALFGALLAEDKASVAEAIAYGFYAVLSGPPFLYRTESGGDWTSEGLLDDYELASEVSYFLTDGPPDAELLSAAASHRLRDRSEIRAQALRLLATPEARANLERAMFSYFGLEQVAGVVLHPEATPGLTVTGELLSSMQREAELFFENTLWQGTLGDLVTSRKTWVNAAIAMPIYGVTAPSTADANGFGEVELSSDRAGLLTLAPFLSSLSHSQGVSVIRRGMAINAAFACTLNPAFPEGVVDAEELIDFIESQKGLTSRQKVDVHDSHPLCAGCHGQWDPYAVALEHYDAVGRYRTHDPMGNVIDAAWTTIALPELFDYDQTGDGVPDRVVVSGPPELAREFMRARREWGGASVFGRCLTMSFINYALADETQGGARAPEPDPPATSCAVRAVSERFATTDGSFAALLAEIAASDTLVLRSKPE